MGGPKDEAKLPQPSAPKGSSHSVGHRPINSQTNSRLIVHRAASEWEDRAQEFYLRPILDGPLFVLILPSVIYSSHATVIELLKILLPLLPRPPFSEDGLYI